MRKLISEIFQDVAKAPTHDDKVNVLRSHNCVPLRQILMAALTPSVRFEVEIPSYRENEETDGYAANSLYVEQRRLYIFMEGSKISPLRRKELLAQILESIDRSDAVLLTKVIRKDISEYGITTDLVNTAFPGLIK